MNARMCIALVRATILCIRVSRIPVSNISSRLRWKGGAGLELIYIYIYIRGIQLFKKQRNDPRSTVKV